MGLNNFLGPLNDMDFFYVDIFDISANAFVFTKVL